MLDPIMIAEYTIYLEQNFCIDEWPHCKQGVKDHFPAMHLMAMEKYWKTLLSLKLLAAIIRRFMIPVEICNQEPVCGADPPPTKPPQM